MKNKNSNVNIKTVMDAPARFVQFLMHDDIDKSKIKEKFFSNDDLDKLIRNQTRFDI